MQALQPAATVNPYAVLIEGCDDDAALIRERYALHRTTRAVAQRTLLLPLIGPSPGIEIDAILARLQTDPEFRDTRHAITIWARPPARVRALVRWVQDALSAAVPGLYLTREADLHMTVLEVASGRTEGEAAALLEDLADVLPAIAGLLAGGKRAGLDAPRVNYDRGGVALGFLPDGGTRWGYHHLRRDAHTLVAHAVPIAPRYVVPSAHLACVRFVRAVDVAALVECVEWINAQLEDAEAGRAALGVDVGPWTVGEEVGLEVRAGACWYGDGGRTVQLGKAID